MLALPVMADEEYPIYIDSEYGYKLDGVFRNYVSSGMIEKIVANESEQFPGRLEVVARRWFSSGSNYGYDTIARFEYNKHKPILIDDSRLSDEYKESLWTVEWALFVAAENDTVKSFRFDFADAPFLTYYTKVDTAYTAYAGRPYMLNEVSNPLMLPLTYSSSNPKAVTVNEKNGEITVVGAGESVITASFAGDDDIQPLTAEWKAIVKEGDHFVLEILSPERTPHTWGSGSTYLAFDMIKVTKDNCNDIYGDGKLSFDIETRTLTMRNYQRSYSEEEDSSMGWTDWLDYSSGPLPLNIKIVGNCAILHNSAGIFCQQDLIISGDGEKNSRLTMLGRFPQFSAGNKLTIDGVQVHALATTPHPLMICKTLRVEDNSYCEVFLDIEVQPGEDPREWGAMAGQVEDVELGEHTIMLTRDVHIENGVFVDGQGLTALRFEIGPKSETAMYGSVSFAELELTDDPTGDEIDGILYTLGESDGIDKTEGCLVLNTDMTIAEVSEFIRDLTPGSAAFAEKFSGLSLLLPVGKGHIDIGMQTSGAYQLAVQIGNNEPVLLTQATKGVVSIPYDLNIATFAFIYAVNTAAGEAPALRRLNAANPDGCVKLYSISLSQGGMGIEETPFPSGEGRGEASKLIKNGTLFIQHNGRTYTVEGQEVK